MVLDVVPRPSASTQYTVNTSPLACGSIRTVKLFGGDSPPGVERARFKFQIPNWSSAQLAVVSSNISRMARMEPGCARYGEKTSRNGLQRGVIHLYRLENRRYA